MFSAISKFISYWYFRYTLVTELYMVEKWERVFIHVFLVVFLASLWYFNVKVVLNLTDYITSPLFAALDLLPQPHIASNIIQNDATQNILTTEF